MSTVRQAVLMNAIADGMPIAKAGELAGYKSRHNAHDVYRSVRDRMPEVLARHGITEDAVALRLRDKLDATKTVTATFMGQISDSIEVADNPTQMAALELVADLHGMTAKDDGHMNIGTVNILWAGHAPVWATRQGDASVTETNASVTVNDTVHTDNQSVTETDGVPISTVEGTGPGPAASTHTHSGKSALASRVKTIKKRGPRLPVLGQRNKP